MNELHVFSFHAFSLLNPNKTKTAIIGGKLTGFLFPWYTIHSRYGTARLFPQVKGVTRMTTMEVLTLLMLLATVIFGILNYLKK
nr:hypothetical protein [uncultured Agathobaculum sp.]